MTSERQITKMVRHCKMLGCMCLCDDHLFLAFVSLNIMCLVHHFMASAWCFGQVFEWFEKNPQHLGFAWIPVLKWAWRWSILEKLYIQLLSFLIAVFSGINYELLLALR